MSAPARVLLIRHAPTSATRRHAFPVDEPLDPRGRAVAAALRERMPAGGAVSAPALRCRQTAELAGFGEPVVDDRWSELDFGEWTGRTLSEVGTDDPDRLTAWLADPQQPPPGGEPLAGLIARVSDALGELCRPGTTTAVFTSGGPVKAALLAVLQAPPASMWRVDVTPCAITLLHGHPPHWTVRSVNSGPADAEPHTGEPA